MKKTTIFILNLWCLLAITTSVFASSLGPASHISCDFKYQEKFENNVPLEWKINGNLYININSSKNGDDSRNGRTGYYPGEFLATSHYSGSTLIYNQLSDIHFYFRTKCTGSNYCGESYYWSGLQNPLVGVSQIIKEPVNLYFSIESIDGLKGEGYFVLSIDDPDFNKSTRSYYSYTCNLK